MTSKSGKILNTLGGAAKHGGPLAFKAKSTHNPSSTPVKFDFRITFNEITKIKDAAKNVVVVWERRDKLEATQPVKVSLNRASVKQTIAVSVTLYKLLDPKQSLTGYEPKMAKIAVRLKTATGKTVGKIHVDMAEFAGVPSIVISKDFSLSNASILTTRIESRLSASGKARRGRANSTGGSVRSEMTTGSGGLSDPDDGASSIDSLNSLLDEIGEEPQIDERRSALARNASSQPNSPTGRGSGASVTAARKEIDTLEERSRKLEESIRNSEGEAARLRDEHEEIERQINLLSRSTGGSSFKTPEDRMGLVEKVTVKIQQIEKSNTEMEIQNEDLEKDLEAHTKNTEKLSRYRSGDSSGNIEGAALKQELLELQAKVDHEPELVEVAKEFTETKALLSLVENEKDEIISALRDLYGKANKTPGPGSVLSA